MRKFGIWINRLGSFTQSYLIQKLEEAQASFFVSELDPTDRWHHSVFRSVALSPGSPQVWASISYPNVNLMQLLAQAKSLGLYGIILNLEDEDPDLTEIKSNWAGPYAISRNGIVARGDVTLYTVIVTSRINEVSPFYTPRVFDQIHTLSHRFDGLVFTDIEKAMEHSTTWKSICNHRWRTSNE